MQKLLSETALCWHRLEVVFVLREILRHSDQFSSNVIPVLQQHLGRPHRWLRRSFFLHRVLRGCECPENSDSKNHTYDLLLHSPTLPGISLLQSGVPQHFQELFLCAHVDGLRYQLPIPIIDKALGNPRHHERVVYFSSRIEQYRERNLALADKWLDFRGLFIGNTKHHEPLRSKALIKRL